MTDVPDRIFCVECRQPLLKVELGGTWGMCNNNDCPRVGLLSGISLTVKKSNKQNAKITLDTQKS
jgi:hypothetical protein